MKNHNTVLLVDDDPSIREMIRLFLEKEGFNVLLAARGDDALALFRRSQPDMMLLDVMLPGVDGWQVLRSVRKTSPMPIIMLTAKDETFDKVLGLELGADDYITKPFDKKELLARVKAVLRRTQGSEEPKSDEIVFSQLSVSLKQYRVTYEGKELEMPPRELQVLYFLCAHPGQVFTREQLLEQVWGFDFIGESSRTVDVHIKRLREKLPNCEQYGWNIRTVWSVGYKFEVK